MVEKLKVINLMDKRFKFVNRTKEKFIYKFEDKELEQLSILELLFSEEEQKIKKIDIYNFIGDEPLENIHITKGADNIIEVDYYQTDCEYITIDKSKDFYNVSIHLLYSNLDNSSYLESNQLDLIKKGHKKHKSLYKIPVEENYYITSDKHIHYISANCISKLRKESEFLVPSINAIEYELFTKENDTEKELEDIDSDELEKIDTYYPNEIYIYDRPYYLIGKKQEAIVYRNNEYELLEFEVYFNNEKDKIKEVRLVEYENSVVEGIKIKAKRKIIRLISDNNKILTTLCNRKRETAIINGHTVEKNIVSAKAIINNDGALDKMELKIQNQLGTFNLTNSLSNRIDYVDKNMENYTVASNSILQYRILSLYASGIIRKLEKELIHNEEKVLSLIKNL